MSFWIKDGKIIGDFGQRIIYSHDECPCGCGEGRCYGFCVSGTVTINISYTYGYTETDNQKHIKKDPSQQDFTADYSSSISDSFSGSFSSPISSLIFQSSDYTVNHTSSTRGLGWTWGDTQSKNSGHDVMTLNFDCNKFTNFTTPTFDYQMTTSFDSGENWDTIEGKGSIDLNQTSFGTETSINKGISFLDALNSAVKIQDYDSAVSSKHISKHCKVITGSYSNSIQDQIHIKDNELIYQDEYEKVIEDYILSYWQTWNINITFNG